MHGTLNRIAVVSRQRRRHAASKAAVRLRGSGREGSPERSGRLMGEMGLRGLTGGGDEFVRGRQAGRDVWRRVVGLGWRDDRTRPFS